MGFRDFFEFDKKRVLIANTTSIKILRLKHLKALGAHQKLHNRRMYDIESDQNSLLCCASTANTPKSDIMTTIDANEVDGQKDN